MSESEKILEELLVLRCQIGEEKAFRELIELMEDRLLYYVRRLLHDEEAAYDVLQEVWVTVYRKVRTLRDAKLFRAWLYRIAHDKAITIIRREVSREQAEQGFNELALIQTDDFQFSPDDAAQIHLTMEKLSPLHREVLTLFFLEEFTYQEVAAITRCSVGTVKSRLYYAKQSLRRMMKGPENGKT